MLLRPEQKGTNVGEIEGALWAYSGLIRTPGHCFALVILPLRITHPLRIGGGSFECLGKGSGHTLFDRKGFTCSTKKRKKAT